MSTEGIYEYSYGTVEESKTLYTDLGKESHEMTKFEIFRELLDDLERGVRDTHNIFRCMGIKNPYTNPAGKSGEFDVNVGALTLSGINSNHKNWPGLITITSISPNKSQKSIAVYTKTALDEPLIWKVIILE